MGEIEVAVTSIEGVDQSCALYDDKNKRIVLFYVAKDEVIEKMIYKDLKLKVPTYMLPALIIHIDKFPLNPNGKVDRVVLKREFLGE